MDGGESKQMRWSCQSIQGSKERVSAEVKYNGYLRRPIRDEDEIICDYSFLSTQTHCC